MRSVTWLRVAGVSGLLIVAGLLLPAWSEAPRAKDVAPVSLQKDKAKDKEKKEGKSVEDLMEAMHGEDGLRTQVAKAIRANKLADAKKPMDEWVKLAGELSKAEPPRGSAESWKKLTAAYEKQVASMAAAVKSQNKQTMIDGLNAAARGCNGCHTAHQPH